MPSSAMRRFPFLALVLLWVLSFLATADSIQATSSSEGAG